MNNKKNVISTILNGTSNQINVSGVGTGTISLGLPQNIDTKADVTFNSGTFSSLTGSSFISVDGTGKLIDRILNGTNNRITVNTVGNTTTLSTPQDINTTSTPTFAGITTNSIESIGNTLNIGSNNATQNLNIGSGTGLQTVNIGSSGSGVTTINIGAAGDIVNVAGSLNYIQTDNLEIKDNTITINKGSVGSGTARNAGIHIRDNNIDNQGYMTVSGTGNSFTFKAPENGFVLSTPVLTGNTTVVTTGESQTITGTKTFSGTVNLNSLIASKLLLTDGSKNMISSLYNESDLVLTSTNQNIGGVKTFTSNPIISPGVGVNGEIFIRGNNETGFSLFSSSNANGLQVWSTSLSTTLLNLRNTLTANRLLTTDGSNYLASASIGVSDLVLTSGNQTIGGNKTFSGTLNISALTASTYLGLDASKNIVSLANPTANLLSSNNTWTGTNTFSNTVNLSGLTASRFLTLDASRNIISATVAPVLVSGNQSIAGVKTFTTNPIINPGAGVGGELFIRGNNETGFSLFSTNNTNGLQIWSTVLSTTLLNLRNALTANRLVTTDGSNYLSSASVGVSDLVLTSGNQTVAGEKTFSTGIRLPTVGGTASLLDFYEVWNSTVTFSGPFTSNPTMNLFVVRVGRLVTISLEGCLGTSPAFGTGNTASSTTNIIPARFLGGTKCFGTFKGYNGPGTTVVAVFMIVLSTGQIQVQLVSGNWGTSVNTGWDAMTGSNVI